MKRRKETGKRIGIVGRRRISINKMIRREKKKNRYMERDRSDKRGDSEREEIAIDRSGRDEGNTHGIEAPYSGSG